MGSHNQKHVLIVEDDKAIAQVLELKLLNANIAVDKASDGEAAIDMLKIKKYDLIMTDLIMPKLDGFGLLSKMHKIHADTPKVVMSNLDQQEDIEKAKGLGAIEFLPKFEMSLTGIAQYVENYLETK